MQSTSVVKNRIDTVGDLRAFLSNIAVSVIHGDVKVAEAVVAVKACEQVNASLYSEAKIAAIRLALGEKSAPLGKLPIRDA